jgi:hypothetical protein
MNQKLYAIKAPSGLLLWDTASPNRVQAWGRCYYRHLYRSFNVLNNPTKAAYARGWRCVPVKLIEIVEKK